MTEFRRSILTKDYSINFAVHAVQTLRDKRYFIEIAEANEGLFFCEVRFDKEKKLWVLIPPVAEKMRRYEGLLIKVLKESNLPN